MASAELCRRVEKVVAYPPLCEMDHRQRREFQEACSTRTAWKTCRGEVEGGNRDGGAEPAAAAVVRSDARPDQ